MNKWVSIKNLQPNNWFLNKAKLEVIRAIWSKGQQNTLPPILICKIDSLWALIDGHTRAFVAWERKQNLISVTIKQLSKIDNNKFLYEWLHRNGPKKGIVSIFDLAERILEPQDYQKQWIEFCYRLSETVKSRL